MTWTSESSRVPQEQQIRDSLIRSMDANGATPSRFLELLDAVTRDEIWRRLKDRHSRPFGLFTDFVMAERPEGLGLHGKEDPRKHLALQHKEEREPYRRQATVDRMAGMRQRVNGLLGEEVPEAPDRARGRPTNDEFKNSATIFIGPARDNDYLLARLKRDDPDEAQRIVQGKTTANAAARARGWRKPRIVLAKPETVASALIKHMPREALQHIAQRLREYLEPGGSDAG